MGKLKIKEKKPRPSHGGVLVLRPGQKPPKGRSWMVIDQQGYKVKESK
jgi:hypothetical protein